MNKMKLNIQLFGDEILTNKKSTGSGPYVYYTINVTTSERTANSVKLTFTIDCTPANNWGTGRYPLTGVFSLNGVNSKTVTLKSDSDVWTANKTYTKKLTYTLEGLSVTQTSITNVKFGAYRSGKSNPYGTGDSHSAGIIKDAACKNIAIDSYPEPRINIKEYTLFDTLISFEVESGNEVDTTLVRMFYGDKYEDFTLSYNYETEKWETQVPASKLTPKTQYTFTFKGYNGNENIWESTGQTITLTTLPKPIAIKDVNIELNNPDYNSSDSETWAVTLLANLNIETPLNDISDLDFIDYEVTTLDGQVVANIAKDKYQYTQKVIASNLSPKTTYNYEIMVLTNWSDPTMPDRVAITYYNGTFTTLEKNRKIWIKTGESTWAKGIPYIKTSNGWVMGKSAYIKTSSGWIETTDI